MKLSKKSVFLMVLITISLISVCCYNKPVKTVAYFNAHPEELQVEAKRCVKAAGNKVDIAKDQSCMNVIQAEQEMCRQKMSMMGNPFGIDCDDKVAMMAVAYHGL